MMMMTCCVSLSEKTMFEEFVGAAQNHQYLNVPFPQLIMDWTAASQQHKVHNHQPLVAFTRLNVWEVCRYKQFRN